jgi:GNAT superfamily N-acetyltransferase
VNTKIQIRAIGPRQRDLLIAMYDRFEPLGAAFGLPPHTSEARHDWVRNVLSESLTVAAFSPAGEIVGHCFLAADKPNSAEIAVFVRQDFRRRGVGAELVKKALKWASAKRMAYVWALTAYDNRGALQLLINSGFRLLKSTLGEVKLEIACALAENIL